MKYYNINQHTFEIINKIPLNYLIWNIGENMGNDELLPLCQVVNKYNVVTDTLKAIKMNKTEVLTLCKNSMRYGLGNAKACERMLLRKNASNERKNAAKQSLEIFKKYM